MQLLLRNSSYRGAHGRLTRRIVARLAACLCLAAWSLLCVPAARGAEVVSLGEYRERIADAALAVDSLLYANEEEQTEAAREQQRAEIVRYVRDEIAAIEAVTWDGRRFEPDNSWVYAQLDRYEQSTGMSASARSEILRALADRLQALNESLAEASGEAIAASGTGDGAASARSGNAPAADAETTKRRLAGILQQAEYNEKAGRGSALADLWRRFVAWLQSLVPDAPAVRGSDSRLMQLVALLIIAALIAVAVWKLLPLIRRPTFAGRNLFRSGERTALGERLRPNVRAADLLAEAEALAREGNVRYAIRKAYIAFLCELAERRILALAAHKTNRDYLEAVRTRAALAGEMKSLIAAYERHWYGDRPAAADEWRGFRTSYERALKQGIRAEG